MSSSFLQWNPAGANQDTDATYLTDPVRTGGGAVDGLCPSATFNKFAYQTSSGVAAIMQSLANKGFTCSDASYATLTSVMANLLTTADVRTNPLSVPYSPNPVFNAANATRFEIILNGNVTSSTLGNVRNGDLIVFQITQGGAGGYTFSWPGNCFGTVDVPPDAGSVNIQMFYVGPDLNARATGPLMSV